MKTTLGIIAFAGIGAISFSLATGTIFASETYLYVNKSGTLSSAVAATPTLAIEDADNIKMHSGVIDATAYAALTSNTTVTPTNGTNGEVYAYVTASNDLATVKAMTAEEAIATAPNIKSTSGVMLVTE